MENNPKRAIVLDHVVVTTCPVLSKPNVFELSFLEVNGLETKCISILTTRAQLDGVLDYLMPKNSD